MSEVGRAAAEGEASEIKGQAVDLALDRRNGRLLVAAAAVCWSAGGLMARTVSTDPWTTVFWRGLFCAAFLLAVTALRERRATPAVFAGMGRTGLGMAVCFATASTCFIMALSRTSVANALVIQSLSPFMAGLLGWAWMGERVAGRTWAAMGLALLGTAIMVSRYFYATPVAGSLSGDLLAFTVAFAFAVATVFLRRRRQVQMLPAAALAALLTSVVASVSATPGSAGAGDLVLLALFGACQLGFGMILFTAGARRIPVAEASLIAVLESVLGPVWVWLALGENPGLPSLLGGTIVLAALAGHTAADLRLERRAGMAQAGSRNRSSTGT
jgi:drug/metabolite transporter (DMT)-like permease